MKNCNSNGRHCIRLIILTNLGCSLPRLSNYFRKDELLHQKSTSVSGTARHGLPVSSCVTEPVFSAYKAPGSQFPVVESSERGGVKSENTFCGSSRYRSLAFRPPQGLPTFFMASLKAPLPSIFITIALAH